MQAPSSSNFSTIGIRNILENSDIIVAMFKKKPNVCTLFRLPPLLGTDSPSRSNPSPLYAPQTDGRQQIR